MFKTLLFLLIILNLSLSADEEEAKEMFKEADCMSCHNNEDFESAMRKKKNFKQLHDSVQACQQTNDAEWFDDEALDVSRYLNKKFYHYKEIE